MGWPVSSVSSRASSAALASTASARRSSRRPRSAAEVALQAAKAERAASTARSTSRALASATSASLAPSCGLSTGKVAPSTPSTNSPPMNSLLRTGTSGGPAPCWSPARSEVDGVGGQLAGRDQPGQVGVGVLPHQQHRPLGGVALVADVGGHGRDVAGLHQHLAADLAAVAVLDLPVDLVGELHEPLHAVVAVDDRQDVLLGGGAEQAVFAGGDHRRVPGHVRARQVLEEVERAHLVLEAGLRAQLGLVLRHVLKLAVDREAVVVGAQALVVGHADHALGGDPVPGDRLAVVATLGTEGGAGLVRAGERVEAVVGPVVENRLEGLADHRRRQVLEVVQLRLAVAVVVAAGEEVDGAVVVDGAEDAVEVDDAVEEVPGHVALQRLEEGVGAHHVAAGRPFDVDEVLVAPELELPELVAAVALGVRLGRLDAHLSLSRCHLGTSSSCPPPPVSPAHPLLGAVGGASSPHMDQSCGQSRTRLTDFIPPIHRVTPLDGLEEDDAGALGVEPVGGADREQGHVAAAGAHLAHARAGGLALQRDRALELRVGLLPVAQLHQLDGDLAVHHQRELVVGAGPPRRGALRAHRLEHVLAVLADRHLLVGPGAGRHLEHVGEGVVPGVVVDDLDVALLVVVQGPKPGREARQASHSLQPLGICTERCKATMLSLRCSHSELRFAFSTDSHRGTRMSTSSQRDPERDFVQSLGRGLAVLQVFSRDRPSVTISEAAEAAGLTRATARRILFTLEQLGYVRSENRRFLPTPRVLGIGYAYLSSMDMWQSAHPFLAELADLTQESCSAATLDGTEVVYVARVASPRVM